MRSQTVKFEMVTVVGQKSGTCPACGKKATRKKEFWATINPFNKNSNGEVKGRQEVKADVMAKRDCWLLKPTYHAKCGGSES